MNMRRILFNFLNKRGQATTEVVLLFPLFLVFMIFFARIFSLLVLVQKMEIASAYAARRWQLESHSTYTFQQGWDKNFLSKDIQKRVEEYIGFKNPATRDFLNLRAVKVEMTRSQMWNEIKITVFTNPTKVKMICKYDPQIVCQDERIKTSCMKGYDYMCLSGGKMEVKKFVPSRDRPIPFRLPVYKK
ncbi:hypothetical protein Dip510_001013 [Elusimicrobium posterum]|uniref:TadE/TadG family type IV pilus assembly protein n=1 Tax=Elusimicrobium posterum TaxID=3116653 RepID=UPI003C728C66